MLEPVFEILKPYDSADLLATIAALQICPENADHAIRLEALAHAAVAVPLVNDKPRISRHRLNRLCNEPPLGEGEIQSQEDPCPNAFTEAFTFYGGSYIVFPGSLGEPTFSLKHLNEAVFFSKSFKDHKDFRDRIFELNQVILVISNAVAQRAGLRRNLPPTTALRQIIIPQNLDNLKAAVQFTTDEIDDIFDIYGLPKSAISPFIVEFGELSLESYTFQNSPLHAKPIVRDERNFIISEPSMLLAALRHRIILTAKEYELLNELSLEYHLAVLRTVGKSLTLFGMEQIPVGLPAIDEDLLLHESIWTLDTDKVIYVAVNTDNFDDYVGEHVFEDHNGQPTADLIDTRLALVEEAIFDQACDLNEVFLMVVQSGIGRTNVYGLTMSGLKTDPPFLMLSASELEVLSLLFGYDKLTLYKFAKASDILRKNAQVIAWSTLDEFETYRSHDFSFYLSDDRRPNLLIIQAGDERYLRVEVFEKLDIHAVPYLSPGLYKEVVNIYHAPEVPIYSSLDLIGKRMDYFVEIVSLPTWVSVNSNLFEDNVLEDYHPNPGLFVEMISYWLWQFDPDLNALLAGVKPDWPMVIYVDLDLDQNWQAQAERNTSEEALGCEINPESFAVRVVFYPPIMGLIQRVDNWGEMVCMRLILENVSALLETLGWKLEARRLYDNIHNIIDKHSKVPNKKKVLSLNPYDNPTLMPGNRAQFRKVQEADRSILLDELGEYLTKSLKFPIGLISEDRVTWVLNKAVEYYYLELKNLISSLRPKHLIEFLVSHYEAIVSERATRKLTIPTQLACFSKEDDLVKQLEKQIPEINEAALACRFLIEYVTAKPPKGIRPISLSVYDRLMALSSEIIGRGNQSDLAKYGIYKLELSILESGRLGLNRQRYLQILNSFLGVRTLEEMDQARKHFHSWWKTKSPINEEEIPQHVIEMNLACKVEFGITLLDISKFVSELGELYVDARKDKPIKVKLNILVNQIQEITGWEEQKITKIVDFLSLGPRGNFLIPEKPFQNTDVYPWRMSRGLSYIRRPLLQVFEIGECVIYFGIRHLFESFDYILQMSITGRLQSEYHSKEMRNFLGRVHRQDGEDFNQIVATKVSEIEGSIIRPKAGKLGRLRVGAPVNDLGDIDVFLLLPRRKQIFLIECKNIEIGRTPIEMSRELESLFNGNDKSEATVAKHLRRQKWVEENLETILLEFSVRKRGIWRVQSLLVVNEELITPHFQASPIPVYSLLRLTNDFIPSFK